jgi:hypothetical protein
MISDAAAKQVNALDFPATQVGIAEISQAVVASLKAQLQKLSEAIMRLSALQRESSDLAFLLVSGFSYVAQKPVSSMGAPEAAFCVAEDLYKITQFPSALPSFEAPIGSLLKPAKAVKKELTIATAITSVSGDLRKKCLLDSTSYPKSLPLHFALNKCEEVSGAASWTAAFGAMTGLDASLTVTPGQLAAQFYLENMLASQLGG